MAEIDRRDFLKIVGMTAGAAATVACKEPVHHIIPYLNQPEEIVPGVATYYNTVFRGCGAAYSVRVKTREGRPIKVDGNPDGPLASTGLDVRGQLSLMRTYDHGRFKGPMRRVKAADGSASFEPVTWEEAMNALVEAVRANPGKTFLLGGADSGTRDALLDQAMSALGSPGNRLRFEPYAQEALRAANEQVFGTAAIPQFAIAESDVLVAFGTDFMETWLSPLENQVGYARARRDGKGFAAFVGPRLGLSGGNTDQWIAPVPGTEVLVAIALASEVAKRKGGAPEALRGALAKYSAASVAERTGVDAPVLEKLADRIAAASAPLALPPGVEVQGTNAARFAAAVQILNVVSGAIGKTVLFGADHELARVGRFQELSELVGRMRGGEVGVLLVHETNPAHTAPQVGLADALQSGKVFTVSFASAPDETSQLADLILPDHTPYESWGDVEPVRGTKLLQQPVIRPLFDTRATVEVLFAAAKALGASVPEGGMREAVRDAWGGERALQSALARGGSWTKPAGGGASLAASAASLDFEPVELAGNAADPVLVVYPSHHFYDGRLARIQALHEIPDPVTKTMWGSYAELHEGTAKALGIELGDRIVVTTEGGEVELPAVPHLAVRPGVIAIQVGRGGLARDVDAPVSGQGQWQKEAIGVNAFQLIPGKLDAQSGALAWLSTHAAVRNTKVRGTVIRAQLTFDQEDRGFVKSTTLAALVGGGDGHGEGHGEHGGHGAPRKRPPLPVQGDAEHLERKEYDPAHDAAPDGPYRWGMSIDQDQCNGCNACIAGCITENNIPVVGPENCRVGREMHWIRVERYVEANEATGLEVHHTPMLCQHCGAAPCESVCPALATYHSGEGLNVMVPNRCIGTRFCSNNCPYKARRFNHWSYNWYVPEPENLALNPDVMVRAKGVMEKCTFCVQRINAAKDVARRENRTVKDGEFTVACAQACPSNAIVFGNLREEGEVRKLRKAPRAFVILDHLYTRPAISYLKSIRRVEEA
jgi:anaerobic selenocysteine-containing dehydrogenase/Fe-S-cluster-containing dehydrogenase component